MNSLYATPTFRLSSPETRARACSERRDQLLDSAFFLGASGRTRLVAPARSRTSSRCGLPELLPDLGASHMWSGLNVLHVLAQHSASSSTPRSSSHVRPPPPPLGKTARCPPRRTSPTSARFSALRDAARGDPATVTWLFWHGPPPRRARTPPPLSRTSSDEAASSSRRGLDGLGAVAAHVGKRGGVAVLPTRRLAARLRLRDRNRSRGRPARTRGREATQSVRARSGAVGASGAPRRRARNGRARAVALAGA